VKLPRWSVALLACAAAASAVSLVIVTAPASGDTTTMWTGTVSWSWIVDDNGYSTSLSCENGGSPNTLTANTFQWDEQVTSPTFSFAEPADGQTVNLSVPVTASLSDDIAYSNSDQNCDPTDEYSGSFGPSKYSGSETTVRITRTDTGFDITLLAAPSDDPVHGSTTAVQSPTPPQTNPNASWAPYLTASIPITAATDSALASADATIDEAQSAIIESTGGNYDAGLTPTNIGYTGQPTFTSALSAYVPTPPATPTPSPTATPSPTPSPSPTHKPAPAPKTSITKGPAATTTSKTASFSFTSNEAGAHFTCKLDKSMAKACKSPKRYAQLAVGRHKLTVDAINRAGLKDATPATRSWTIKKPKKHKKK
jgi:hypothetical protein